MGLGSHIDVIFQFCQEDSFRLILFFFGGVGSGWGLVRDLRDLSSPTRD